MDGVLQAFAQPIFELIGVQSLLTVASVTPGLIPFYAHVQRKMPSQRLSQLVVNE